MRLGVRVGVRVRVRVRVRLRVGGWVYCGGRGGYERQVNDNEEYLPHV